ncbi:hypothetical protein ScPMuIL_012382 [Solemya velum]
MKTDSDPQRKPESAIDYRTRGLQTPLLSLLTGSDIQLLYKPGSGIERFYKLGSDIQILHEQRSEFETPFRVYLNRYTFHYLIIRKHFITVRNCGMTSRFYLTIVVFAICVIELRARPSSVPCPRSHIPDGSLRGANLIEGGKPRYWIDVGEAKRGYSPGQIYNFLVGAQDSKYPFDDVVLTASLPEATCESGKFIAMDNQYQPQDCPDVISTAQKRSMDRVFFRWTAPKCGCIHVRATVISEGVYYQESEDQPDGHLSKVICVQNPEMEGEDLSSRKHETLPVPQTGVFTLSTLTRSDKLQLLCEEIGKYSSFHLVRRHEFYQRRGMADTGLHQLSDLEYAELESALDSRRLDVMKCCRLAGNERSECVVDIRRHRIDRFCAVGLPDVPFSKNRETWMRNREAECCWINGEERYDCFNYTKYNSDRPKEFTDGTTYPSQSMDDFDPVNDIEDYPIPLGDNPQTDDLSFTTKVAEKPYIHQSEKSKRNDTMQNGDIPEPKITNAASTNNESNERPTEGTNNSNIEDNDEEEQDEGVDEDEDDADADEDGEDEEDEYDQTFENKDVDDDVDDEDEDEDGDEDEDEDEMLENRETESLKKWKQELRERADKNKVKLQCCTDGESVGFSISNNRAYRECPKASRKHSSSLKSRRQMCRTSFLQCCLEAAVGRTERPPTDEAESGNDEIGNPQKRLSPETSVVIIDSNNPANSEKKARSNNGRNKKDSDDREGENNNNDDYDKDDDGEEDDSKSNWGTKKRNKSVNVRVRNGRRRQGERTEGIRHRQRSRSKTQSRRNRGSDEEED